jgi:membrane-associated phospholipid phosphatase
MTLQKDLIHDISSLGGLPCYLVATGLFVLVTPAAMRVSFALTLLGALVACFAITALMRFVWFVPRPKPVKHHNAIERIDASSFPSLHAMRIAVLCTIVTLLTVVTASALTVGIVLALSLIVTTAVCWARVKRLRHRVVDVAVGAIIGVIVAVIALIAMVAIPSWLGM